MCNAGWIIFQQAVWVLKSKIFGQKLTYLHTQRKPLCFVNLTGSSKIGYAFRKCFKNWRCQKMCSCILWMKQLRFSRHKKIILKIRFWHFLWTFSSLFRVVSFEYVDFWHKILLFRQFVLTKTKYLLTNHFNELRSVHRQKWYIWFIGDCFSQHGFATPWRTQQNCTLQRKKNR